MRVLVTRAEPAASKTAEKLHKLGHEPVLFPMSRVTCVCGKWMDQDDTYCGFIFTSANAITCLSDSDISDMKRSQAPVFTVGQTTQKAALNAGLQRVVCAHGNGAQLAELIISSVQAQQLSPTQQRPLLYLTTQDRTKTLEQALSEAQIFVKPEIIYQVTSDFSQSDFERLGQATDPAQRIDMVMFYSAKAVQRFFKSLTLSGKELFTSARYGCLSSHIASHIPEPYADRTCVAIAPEEHHLLAIIRS